MSATNREKLVACSATLRSNMSRKVDIRTKMAELQREYSGLTAELKEIEELEKKAVLRERYKEYKHKVFVYSSADKDPKFIDLTDEDREQISTSERTGIPFTGQFTEGAYMVVRDEAEYMRNMKLFAILEAVKVLEEKKSSDKEKHIKIILSEV